MSNTSDERPPLWVGHITLPANDVARANDYWVAAGMRAIVQGDGFAVLELRGGTHMVLVQAEAPTPAGTPAPFDLMVEDLDATHASFTAQDLAPSEVSRGNIHDSFTLTDPSGNTVTFNSTHVSNDPV
jgi:catechol 2,3-dioxygenase-like lactoylglutathione lyase family enzyme